MRVIDVLNSPWAIIPEKLAEITEIYATHLRGEKIDVKALEAQLGRPLVYEPKPYTMTDGVALLHLEGVLAKKMNLFMEFSGGTSTQILARDFKRAVADPDVRAIVLVVDSPGGTVDGTQELAHAVMSARAAKPIVAYADGMMASAAYYIGSAADAVYISSDATVAGSIGVAMQHVDYSKRGEMFGMKVTDIFAGKYKRIATNNAPLSDEGRAYLQSQVDHLYSVFVDDVAAQRGVSVDAVLKNMADGRIFIGQQAITAGLADGRSTLEAVIAELASGTYTRRRGAAAGAAADTQPAQAPTETADANGAGAAPSVEPQPQEETMDLKTLKEKHPEVAKALIDEGFAAGSQAERARIQSVFAQAMPGHAKLVQQLAFDGKTTGPEAATQILAAERTKLGKKAEDMLADASALGGTAPTPAADPGAAAPAAAAAELEKKPIEERCKAKWDADAALRAEYADDFKAYVAFEKAQASGRVRILGGKK